MAQHDRKLIAAIGFRVRTSRATTVLLVGPASSPRMLERRNVELWDPKVPESREPYHAALDLSDKDGAKVVRRAAQAAEAVAIRAVREIVKGLCDAGHELCAIGLVVGSDIDPEKLLAHASEGRRRSLSHAG